MSTTGTKKGGQKTGGRPKGQPNKKTIQKLNELSDRASQIVRSKEKRGIEVLNELMKTAMSFAAMEQRKILEYPPDEDGERRPPQQMLDRFWKAMENAGVFAKELARYQDPTFKAITVIPPPPPPPPGDDAKVIEGKAIRTDDPVAVARIYQQMVRIVR